LKFPAFGNVTVKVTGGTPFASAGVVTVFVPSKVAVLENPGGITGEKGGLVSLSGMNDAVDLVDIERPGDAVALRMNAVAGCGGKRRVCTIGSLESAAFPSLKCK
jgi:hypothetical protein